MSSTTYLDHWSLPSESQADSLFAIAQLWMARSRQRKQLAQLEDYQLEDIGISRSQALAEAAKPFWQA